MVEYISKIFLILLVFGLAHFALRLFFHRLMQQAKNKKKCVSEIFFETALVPFILILWAAAASLILNLLVGDMSVLRGIVIVAALIWFAFRFKRKLQKHALKCVAAERAKIDILSKIATLALLIVAVLFAMDALGFNMQTLSIIGGISGFSLGFASKDVIANFFGGLMLYLTRPFVVGDLIKSKEKDFEGTVEEISWYYTHIKGSDRLPIYVPNSLFASIIVTNLTRMSHWNIDEKLHVRYKDIDHIEKLVGGIKNILKGDEQIDQNQPIRVHFDRFTDSSLEIAIWACAIPTTKDDIIGIKQEIFIKIAKLLHSLGADFASPTTTIEVPSGIRIIS